jgi:hypothetical protein
LAHVFRSNLLPFALVVSLSSYGCSSEESAASTITDSGGTFGDSAPSGTDGSVPDGSTESGQPTSDAGSASKAGFIGVISYATGVPTVFTNSVIAQFLDGPGYSFGKGCQREIVGNCFVLLCDLTDGGSEMPPPGAAESAGTISIGGTQPPFSLVYDAGTMMYGAVPMVPTDMPIFAGGNTITFAAAGRDVGMFSDGLVAPSPLAVTLPALASAPLSIDTGKDLVFAWTGSSAGKVAFNIRTTTTSSMAAVSSSFVSCQFDASAMTGTIPASLLQKLRKTDASTTGSVTTDLSSTKDIVVGDHSVHLAVGSIATKADGKSAYTTSEVTIF